MKTIGVFALALFTASFAAAGCSGDDEPEILALRGSSPRMQFPHGNYVRGWSGLLAEGRVHGHRNELQRDRERRPMHVSRWLLLGQLQRAARVHRHRSCVLVPDRRGRLRSASRL